jgi:hypothetical protein
MADCPECEYCCIIGLCCPPAAQLVRLTAFLAEKTGSDPEECEKYAHAIVEARKAAQEHGA